MTEPCCTAPRSPVPTHTERPVPSPAPRSTRGQVRIPSGAFLMGDAFDEGYAADGELPVHEVELSAFHMDATAVTNAQFATFVKATGHLTDAERFGTSAVFHST